MDGVRLWVLGFTAAAVIILLLHVWFSSKLIALEELRPRWKTMMQSYPWCASVLKSAKRLEWITLAEQIVFTILFTLLCAGAVIPIIFIDCPIENVWAVLSLGAAISFLCSLFFSVLGMVLPLRGRKNPEKLLKTNKRLFWFFLYLYMPLYGMVAVFSKWFCGKDAVSETVTEEEILSIVDAGTENGLIATQQKEMIDNILEFDDVDVSDVMTHRREIVGVSVDMKIMDVVYLAVNENYSRMPVYQDSIDNIIGVLIVKDLMCLIGAEKVENFSIQHFMREMLFVPETAKCKNVLTEMTRHNAQMAVAVDEYGGTAGIVTVEDILEEIVGSIRDEYDEEEAELELRAVSENVYIIKGSADPEDILPELGIMLSEEQKFDTMSGFLVEQLGRIPDAEETPIIEYKNIRFTVLLIEDNWITKIKAERLMEKTKTVET